MQTNDITGRLVVIEGKIIKTARLANEWLEDLEEPSDFVEHLRRARIGADVFTFWERLSKRKQEYPFPSKPDAIAAIPLKTYDFWWEKQIGSKTRNLVRKAEKSGVEVRVVPFDDDLVEGISAIFNETPIRQGRRFNHFGKSLNCVKREMSRELEQSIFLGAYVGSELIGFIKLLDAGRYFMAVEIISKLAHRDKSSQNSLLAFAVRTCCDAKIPYLVYSRWISGSLGDFKRRNGFEKFELSRYFVPLSLKGRCVLRLNLYPSLTGLPQFESMRQCAKTLRRHWYFFVRGWYLKTKSSETG
jgi:hypothetical protein